MGSEKHFPGTLFKRFQKSNENSEMKKQKKAQEAK
jgi:hypothetical protein